jgi:histidinol-phosphatase (PHP family)
VVAISSTRVAAEVSTAGLRKPVAELYPAQAMLEMLVDAGAPVALSSDAHRPGDVGRDFDRAVAALVDAGVTELSTFARRERRMRPLDAPDAVEEP